MTPDPQDIEINGNAIIDHLTNRVAQVVRESAFQQASHEAVVAQLHAEKQALLDRNAELEQAAIAATESGESA